MSDTMRDAFEAWDCQEFCIDVEHYKQAHGVYLDAPIRNRWLTWQAAQSQPAPPVPSSVQEIMPLVNAYVRACGEFLISGDDSADEALKPLQAALTALVDDNHRLKFELDGVRAMRGPEWQPIETAPKQDGVWIVVLGCYPSSGAPETIRWFDNGWDDGLEGDFQPPTHWMPLPPPPTHGIEPEQGGNHG